MKYHRINKKSNIANLHCKAGMIYRADNHFLGKSLKAQLRQANNSGVQHSIIVGEDELKSGNVILRDMSKAEQKIVSLAELPGLLQ